MISYFQVLLSNQHAPLQKGRARGGAGGAAPKSKHDMLDSDVGDIMEIPELDDEVGNGPRSDPLQRQVELDLADLA
jgi:hypothetical protein